MPSGMPIHLVRHALACGCRARPLACCRTFWGMLSSMSPYFLGPVVTSAMPAVRVDLPKLADPYKQFARQNRPLLLNRQVRIRPPVKGPLGPADQAGASRGHRHRVFTLTLTVPMSGPMPGLSASAWAQRISMSNFTLCPFAPGQRGRKRHFIVCRHAGWGVIVSPIFYPPKARQRNTTRQPTRQP